MVEDFLEFNGGLRSLARGQKRLTSHVDGIKGSDKFVRCAEFIRNGSLQDFDCPGCVVPVEGDACSNYRQVAEANHRVLRESFFEIRSEEHTSELQSLRHLVCR